MQAADILIYNSHLVPVGADQKQHIEVTRDIAIRFNNTYGEVFTIPEEHIIESVAVVPGVDGRKMSKSYDNVIPLFATPEELRRLVMRIKTNSQTPDAPKDPDASALFHLYRAFAREEETQAMRARYVAGGLGWGQIKAEVVTVIETVLAPMRARYHAWLDKPERLESILTQGEERARAAAAVTMHRLYRAMNFRK